MLIHESEKKKKWEGEFKRERVEFEKKWEKKKEEKKG